MVSFLNANLPVLMQLNRAEGGTFLPWPNGSLLSGRLMPPTEGAGAMLMLGNYRIRIEVPPNTPMGQTWLQLLQREMPGKFRLLSEKQALALVVDLLQQNTSSGKTNKPLQQDKTQLAHAMNNQQEWGKFNADNLPFQAEFHGEHWMLYDKKDGHTQGLLQQDRHGQGFMLHGRLDLEHIGAVAFSLESQQDKPWKVLIHLANRQFKVDVEQLFLSWLNNKQQHTQQALEGAVFESMPTLLGGLKARQA